MIMGECYERVKVDTRKGVRRQFITDNYIKTSLEAKINENRKSDGFIKILS